MKKLFVLFLVLLWASPIFSQCSAASETAAVSEDILEKEQKITKNISEQVEKQIPTVKDHPYKNRLSEIAAKIRPFMGRDLDYEVRIIKRADPHAFSLPGGLTYVTTGMLEFIKSDHEAAAVLSREFTHSDLSHWLIQSSRNEKIDFKTMAEVAAATQSGKVAGNMVRTYLNRAVINFYDIDLEKETDMKALDIMHKAGYNNAGLLTYLERMRIERLKQLYVRGIDIRYKSGFKPLETILETMKFLKPKDDNRKQTDPVRTDMVQANTDMEERVAEVLKYFKDSGTEIKRKYVLNVLIPNVKEFSGKRILTLDRTEVMREEAGYNSPADYEVYMERLNRDLQLETAQYDIQIQSSDGVQVLLIEGKPMIYGKDLPEGEPGLPHIRARIIKALTDARRENFLTDYYE